MVSLYNRLTAEVNSKAASWSNQKFSETSFRDKFSRISGFYLLGSLKISLSASWLFPLYSLSL